MESPEALAEDNATHLSADQIKIEGSVHRGSEPTFHSEIAHICRNDIDGEQGVVKRRSDPKLINTYSTTEDPPPVGNPERIRDEDEYEVGVTARYWRKYRPFGHAIIWLLLTASVCCL